jgi:WD40 repeat protein
LAFSPDGRTLLATGERSLNWIGGRRVRMQALVRRWEVGTWKEMPVGDFDVPADHDWRRPWVPCTHANLLATPDSQGVVFWDLASGQEVFRTTGTGRASGSGLAFSPDGRRFATAGPRFITVCDVPGQRTLAFWKNTTLKSIQSLAFSPDGHTLATVGNDATARLWEADTGRPLAAYAWEIGPLKAVAFSPDGMRAAVGSSSGKIVVWDVE